ncbi:MAG: hypothetical protein ACLGHL_00045 [Actinomycetota bacterium]
MSFRNIAGTSPSTRQRLLTILVASALVAGVGAVLRFGCVGRACEEPVSATADVPFCGLPSSVRDRIVAGFRDGRSPDVMAVARSEVHGGTAFESGSGPAWPTTSETPETLPLMFSGTGVAEGASLPEGVTFDRIAPTVAEIIGLERQHPEVRSGTALPNIASGVPPRLVVLVALLGVGGDDLEPVADGAYSATADPGTQPLDPAALLATIGTGGLPRQHGITGTLLRDDRGRLVKAWSRRSPISVIATLGDDLDESTRQRARIGLVAPDISHQGLIGGNWYIDNDRDDIVLAEPGDEVSAARRVLGDGYGQGGAVDLLGVVLDVPAWDLPRQLTALQREARRVSGDSALFVVAGLGSETMTGASAAEIEDSLEVELGADVVEATTPGGLFIDQQVLADRGLSEDRILAALGRLTDAAGNKVFADVFTSIAVSFERYC